MYYYPALYRSEQRRRARRVQVACNWVLAGWCTFLVGFVASGGAGLMGA